MIETSKGREFVGETFDVFEKNYPDDSYWYARSFHNGEIVETLVDSTAFGSVGVSRYEIDISPAPVTSTIKAFEKRGRSEPS